MIAVKVVGFNILPDGFTSLLDTPVFDEDFLLSKKPKVYEDLCGSGPQSASGTVSIPLKRLHDFKHHAFKVINDRAMDALVASVKENGIITPLIVRRDGNDYEVISGHRRKEAAAILKLETVPCTIADYDDEEALLIMCNSNLLPSERAKSISIKYDILMKRKGLERDGSGRTRNTVAKEMGVSPSLIDRCRFLYGLGDRIMEVVDLGNIRETLAVNKVRFMNATARDLLFSRIRRHNTVFTERCLDEVLAYDKRGELTQDLLDRIVERHEKKKEAAKERRKEQGTIPTIPGAAIARYFPKTYTVA